MSPSNIILGLIVVAIGIYAIVFNKYPGKEISYENAKKKYSTASERKVTLFDGIFCIIYGVAYAIIGSNCSCNITDSILSNKNIMLKT